MMEMKAFACRYGNQSLNEVEGWRLSKLHHFCAAISALLSQEYPDPNDED